MTRYTPGRQGAALAAGLAGALLGLGCDASMYDPRAFDDLADTTKVRSHSAPDGIGAGEYGMALAGGSAEVDGARLLVAARGKDGFAHVRHGLDGAVEVQAIPVGDVNTLDQPNILPDPVIMVGDPDSALAAVGLSNGGSPAMPGQATVAVMDADSGATRALVSLPGPQLVSDLAFGVTDVAGSGERNLAVVRGELLAVIADVDDAEGTGLPTCRHDGLRATSVVLADVDPATEAEEIAFAVAVEGSDGPAAKVHVIGGSLVSDAALTAVPPDPADCFDPLLRQPLATIDGPPGQGDFGARMLAADLGGDGAADLIISAPGSNTVYVYLDLDISAGVDAPLEIAAPADAEDFGAALAAGDLDGDGDDELVIGAPGADLGEGNTGAVYVYDLAYDPSDGGFAEPVVLADAQPEVEQRFGRAAAVVPFGPAGDTAGSMLVVGSETEVFAYRELP